MKGTLHGFLTALALSIVCLALPACRHSSKDAAPGMNDRSQAACEATLKQIVNQHIAAAPTTEDFSNAQLVRKKPYYFKEFGVYPDGADAFRVTLQKTESKSGPYVAEVRMKKVRYATRLKRDKTEADKDQGFLRSTGGETVTYEFRNGKWRRMGSMFVAEKTEESVSGEWLPLREEPKYLEPREKEEQRGWFRRTWYWLTGA